MQADIQKFLNTVHLGEPQVHRSVTVYPLHTARNGGPAYVTLGEAISATTFTVTEVSQSGSVPELKVINKGETPVLIIDGEELVGAKQNRVLNTTVLIKERSQTVVPVSCTEQGRWAYASNHFSEANTVMERKIRSRKSRSVSASLAFCGSHHSDQSEVWNEIQHLHYKASFVSPSSAMHDLYKAREQGLAECVRAFPCQKDQTGLLVMIHGEVVGLDLVSRPEAYAKLHVKLVKSYVLDALLEDARTEAAPKVEAAQSFLNSVESAGEESFRSIGYGEDFRYSTSTIAGSALLHEGYVIHAAFLRLESGMADGPPEARMAALRRRLRHFSV